MNIIEDTRQKTGKHANIHAAFKRNGDKVISCKLPFGDYAISYTRSVDTKKDLQEIGNNLCGNKSERERFIREEKLAQEMECELIFLIEQDGIKVKEDLIGMKIYLNSKKTITGEQLYNAMIMHSHKYGSEFVFCAPSETGEKIEQLLQLRNGGT